MACEVHKECYRWPGHRRTSICWRWRSARLGCLKSWPLSQAPLRAPAGNLLSNPGHPLLLRTGPGVQNALSGGLVVSGGAHASQLSLSALHRACADGGAAQQRRRSDSREASAPEDADEEPQSQWVFRLLRRPEVTPDIRRKEARPCAAQHRRASTAVHLRCYAQRQARDVCCCAA